MRALLTSCISAVAFIVVGCSAADVPAGASPDEPVGTRAPESSATSTTNEACAPQQVAGDCMEVVCKADGSGGVEAIQDDADVPAPSECTTFQCAGGAIVAAHHAAGTACTGGACDGAGSCVPGAGSPCTQSEDCATGFCVDGVCCNDACTGECKSCNVAGAKGICSNVPYYEEDPVFVVDGKTRSCNLADGGSMCNGAGACRKLSRITCHADAQCMSGKCAELKCLGAPGEMCDASSDCLSGTCSVGTCK